MNNARRYTLQHVPFLRMLLPLIAGITWQHISPSSYIIYVWGIIVVGSCLVAWFTRNKALSALHQYTFNISLVAVLITAGMVSYRCNIAHDLLPDMSSRTVATARIESPSVESTHSYRTQATIVALHDDSSTREVDIPVILYIKKSFSASHLSGGNLIYFTPQLQRFESPTLPHSYDNARQMALKGYLYYQYLNDEQWQLSDYTTRATLHDRANRVQSQCIASLRQCGLSPDNTALMSALLWGYRDDIPEDIRTDFSTAGLSHILAVSGLHTGIIAFLLWFLLYPLRYTRLRKLQHILTITVLWIYAFITGLSPSVTRACLMATFIGVAHIIDRRNTSLNALCGSAVIILLLSPMQLFDVGFQLSYTAVAGIILFSPYCDLSSYLDKPHESVRYVSGLIAASIAAQVTTAPLAAYYFHYIPMWGLLSNLIFVPLLPLVVIATLCLQLAHACRVPHSYLTTITDSMVDTLTQGAYTIARLPGATMNDVWITPTMLLVYVVILASIWYMLSRRTLRAIIIVLVAIIVLQVIHISATVTPSTPRAYVPQEREYTNIQLSDNRHNCYIINTSPIAEPPRSGKEWRMSQHFTTHIINHGDTICNADIYIALPFIEYWGTKILWVDDNTWRYCNSKQLYEIDYAIITEAYKGRIKHLLSNFVIDNVILSATIFPQRASDLAAECKNHGIICHDIRQDNTLDIAQLTENN